MIVDGYVRVSRVGGRSGEGFISPAVQREQIEGWASLHGAHVARVFEELDESGARRDRPLLMAAIGRVESGESQGVVVAYLSRFGRSLTDGLRAIERITSAGGMFVSVQEGLDFSTDTGRLMLRMMFSWNEFELDRCRANWAVSTERAVARGVWMGPTPVGYQRGADGRLAVDPKSAPVVRELFRRRAAGASILDLQDYLVREGVRTQRGNRQWAHSVIRSMLRRRAYRGELFFGAFANPASHPALVDEATWQCAQPPHQSRPPPRAPRPALLWGLLRCAGCQRLLLSSVRDTGTSGEYHMYRCPSLPHRERTCPAPVVIMDYRADPYCEQVFWQQLDRARRRPAQQHLRRLTADLDRRERELDAYRDNRAIPRTLGADRFARGLAVRAGRAERALLEVSRAELDRPTSLPPAPELRERWSSMTLTERRAAISEVVECAFVYRGIKRPVEDRLFICLKGRAPQGLPGDNRYVTETRPFDPASCPPATRLTKPARDWSEPELRAELQRFLAGRERWPSFAEFQLAGRASLYRQIDRHAGQRRWAALMKLPYLPGRVEGGGWTEEQVRSELRDYLAGRTDWPSWREFTADRRKLLRAAVRWFGGPERWAPEMGVTLGANQTTLERWSYARIKHELSEFVGDRPDWPSLAEFRAAGREPLYVAIGHTKTRTRVAGELGLYVPSGKICAPQRWTDEAIAAALDELLEGREAWPARNQFAVAGLAGLWNRLDRTGTAEMWARRYGLRPPHARSKAVLS